MSKWKPIESDRKCATCRFWLQQQPKQTYADCRRQPPQFNFTVELRRDGYGSDRDRITVSRFPQGQWPNVAHDDWCGEYAPIRPDPPKDAP